VLPWATVGGSSDKKKEVYNSKIVAEKCGISIVPSAY
jgi:hypothetical protein